jgi:ATP-binding cassette, subfamily B, bacterial
MLSWIAVLRQAWKREAAADPLEDHGAGTSLRQNLKLLIPFLRPHWRLGALSAVLMLLGTIVSLPQPLIGRYVIDDVISSRRLGLLALAAGLMLALSLASIVVNLLRNHYALRFEQEASMAVQKGLVDHLLKLPKPFFESRDTAYLAQRVTGDAGGLRWFYSDAVVNCGMQVVRFVAGCITLFYLDWKLTLLLLAFLPAVPLMSRMFSRKLLLLGHESMERNSRLSTAMNDSLQKVALVKSFSAERRVFKQIAGLMKASYQVNLEQQTIGSVAGLANSLVPAFAALVVLILGAYWIMQGQWTLGNLFAFQGYIGYLFAPPQALAGMNLPFQRARASLERVNAVFRCLPEENYDTGTVVEHLKGVVEFRDVSFSYDPVEPILQGVSLNIAPGEHIGIVGPSGIGKTTLVSLILRFYKPTAGEIYFDGEPASAYELQALRRRIGYVPQNTVLVSASVLDNLRYGNPEATVDEVEQACRVAEIDTFIKNLPDGYNTLVGPRDGNFSAGQRQRISLARALIKNPDILVLDEPTSAIDIITEKSIIDALPALVKQKTLFIVAHRLTTIRRCDRILVIDEDRRVACNTHASLMETNAYYRSLMQVESERSKASETDTVEPSARRADAAR